MIMKIVSSNQLRSTVTESVQINRWIYYSIDFHVVIDELVHSLLREMAQNLTHERFSLRNSQKFVSLIFFLCGWFYSVLTNSQTDAAQIRWSLCPSCSNKFSTRCEKCLMWVIGLLFITKLIAFEIFSIESNRINSRSSATIGIRQRKKIKLGHTLWSAWLRVLISRIRLRNVQTIEPTTAWAAVFNSSATTKYSFVQLILADQANVGG